MNARSLNVAVSNDDAATHDLFSALRRMQRINTLPITALAQLIATLECGPSALESLTVGQLLAMVRTAEVSA